MPFGKLIFSLLVLCSFSVHAAEWPADLAAVISRQDCLKFFPNPHFLEVPLAKETSEKTSLFYFTLAPWNPKLPTLLYVDGGPGQAIGAGPNTLRFTESKNMNIVFFHPRGAGCSQLPLNNSYDRYIGTRFIAEDLEVLRRSLGITKWDLVFGLSYGTGATLFYASQYPSSVSQIVLEGLFNPEFPRDQFQLAVKLGLPTMLQIFQSWPEYSSLSEEQVSLLLEKIITLLKTGTTTTVDGRPFSADDAQAFVSELYSLTYVGPHSAGALNRSQAINNINNIVSLFFDQQVISKLPPANYEFLNKFPYLSYRVFANTMIFDALDLNFTQGASDPAIGIQRAIDLTFPQWKPYLSNQGVSHVQLLSLPASISSSIRITALLGTDDGATPFEGALQYLKGFRGNARVFGLKRFGHQRHFSDACYSQIFDRLLRNDVIDDLLTSKGSICFAPEGLESFN